ncbi:MAG: O-antigen ligase family protein [Chloroflexota bacterium]|nr:O-antigen ligase family protein [Chloroflexota bacterium]
MNRRSRVLILICLVGLLVSLFLSGAVLVARRRVLLQATTTSYTPLSGVAEWEGDWEFSELGADPSEADTERVIIPFSGTDLALQVRRGNYRGYFWVSVDGEPANQLPREEHGAYLVLTSPDYTSQVVTIPVVSGLDDGPHEAVVIADRGWDQWPLAGWSVSRTPDTTRYRWALVGLGAVGLVCLVGVIWGTRERGGAGGSKGQEAGGEIQTAPSKRHSLISTLYSPIFHSPLSILLVAAVFYFSPWFPLTLVSGLGLVVLVCLRLDLGLALVAATAPFYLHPRPMFGKALSMAEILTLLCVLSWAIRQIPNLRSLISKLRLPTSLDLAALLLVLVAIASTFAADYRHVALRELRVVILEPALFYLMLRTSRFDDRAIWRVVDFFVLGAVVVALIGLVQYAFGTVFGISIITAEGGFRRLRSIYGSPNNAALYLGRVLPVLIAVTLFGAARGRRVAYGLAVVPVGLAMLFSFSKGAIILGVPLSLLALGMLVGGPWLWALLGVIAVAVVSAIPLLRTPRFASLLDTSGGTTFFRLQLLRSSWMMFRDHLWLGVGPDNFLYQYRGRYILPAAWEEPDLSHPHNVLLDYGCRLGLGGILAGLWLQVAFWRLALPLRQLPDPDRRALALGLMASMVNFLAHGLVDASYFVIDLAFVFFMTLGLVQWMASTFRFTRSETDELETGL